MEIEIAKKIEKFGGKLYLVGGAVRDEIMGKNKKDEDYCVTNLSRKEFETIFPDAISYGKDFPVYQINGKEFALARKERKTGIGHKQFETTTNKKITIQEDLSRRDITINAIAKDVLTGEIIDPFGGIEDIKNKTIKMVTNAFSEDPLRVYRVARFAATLQFKVEERTIKQMQNLKLELETLSAERVFIELKKALESDKPSLFFETLKKANLLQVHFKEIYNLIGKTQPLDKHPEGDSYNHTMIVLDNSAKMTKKLEVRYSCLVHDLGKGTTPIEMLPHHYGHEERGEKEVIELSKRLKVPKKWESCGKIAAKEHMKGGIFNQMTPKKQLEFLETVQKSNLGLEGMKIVVMCDKNRTGESAPDVDFDKIGETCFNQINGEYIKQKYQIPEGIEFQKKLHEERINWIKNYKN